MVVEEPFPPFPWLERFEPMECARSTVNRDGECAGEGYQWPPALSPDAQWVWDGSRWDPPASARRKWKRSGERWARRSKARLPKWLVWGIPAWLALLVAWIPSVMVVASDHGSEHVIAIVAVALGTLAAMAKVAFGASLGYRRHWAYLGWSVLMGTAAVGLVVAFAFYASVPANDPDDPGVGLGAMFVTLIPTPLLLPVPPGYLLGMPGLRVGGPVNDRVGRATFGRWTSHLPAPFVGKAR